MKYNYKRNVYLKIVRYYFSVLKESLKKYFNK